MSDKLIQEEIREINNKLDLLLEENTIQRQNREAVNDLIEDVSVISKEAVKHMIVRLDDAGVELDSEALQCLVFRLIRNIQSLGMVMETLESFADLAKDMTPIVRQIGLDGVQKFHELEQKGYFELLNQAGKTLDQILSKYSIEDIQKMSENLVSVFDLLTDQRLINKLHAATKALMEIDPEKIEDYSVWKMMRQLNKPEVKKSLGFVMAFINNISKTES
jgi:uncharacterized protein YjgD (DUF1641 family)